MNDSISGLLGEFVGTFLLTFVIGINAAVNGNSDPAIPIGFFLASLVFSGDHLISNVCNLKGYISGAHFNPAVSLAMFLRKKLDFKILVLYTIFQILGGIFAGLILYWMFDVTWAFPGPMTPPLFTPARALICEAIFTLVLAHSAIHTGTRQDNNQFFGLAIGFSLLSAIFTIGPISGAGLNPAVCSGYAIVQAVFGTTNHYDHNASHIWIYILGPYLGSFFSVVMYYLFHRSEFRQKKYEELN